MNKIIQRLCIFFIGIPVVIGLVFLDFYHQLPLHIVICCFSCIGAWELYHIFSKNSQLPPLPFILALNTLIPVSAYACVFFALPFSYIQWVFAAGALIILGYNAFSSKTFEHSNTSAALSIFILFYTGYLITFISRMTIYNNSVYYISVFLFMVFLCDSAAWFTGMLFGKNNRGFVAASPNKSIAGFIGGIAGSVLAAYAAQLLWPEVFTGGLWKPAVLGLLISASAITGDLVESVFKRCSGFKDSGTIMMGRGGVLDSIDSILYSAPFFYIALHFLYGVHIL